MDKDGHLQLPDNVSDQVITYFSGLTFNRNAMATANVDLDASLSKTVNTDLQSEDSDDSAPRGIEEDTEDEVVRDTKGFSTSEIQKHREKA